MAACNDVSVRRNLRKPKAATRPVGRPRKRPELIIFYGYPAEIVAESCCGAPWTAFAYKSGRLNKTRGSPLLTVCAGREAYGRFR
jgi:hypothetical protein